MGAFFLPARPDALAASVKLIEAVLPEDGIPVLGWRDVPINPAALGPTAQASCPVIRQVLVGRPALTPDEDAWERALYLARREMERRAEEPSSPGFYACSLSCRTIVYKALLTGTQLPAFFTDFRYPEYESAIAVFHQRYSTNTLPSWPLAQPFRLLAHNGEINTLWGNRNAMTMRQPMLASPLWGEKIERLREVIWREGSDSASLDNAMELLVRSGRDVVHASMMTIPQAWENYSDLDPGGERLLRVPPVRARAVGRPRRAGVHRWRSRGRRGGSQRPTALPLQGAPRRPGGGRLRGRPGRPGSARGGGVRQGRARRGAGGGYPARRGDPEPGRQARGRRPPAVRAAGSPATWPRWCPIPPECRPLTAGDSLLRLQRAFGYGAEDLRLVLEPMGSTGGDPVWSMGDDTPIPPLSAVPPESLRLFPAAVRAGHQPADRFTAGVDGDVAPDAPRPARLAPAGAALSYARMLRLEHPILLAEEMAALRNVAGFSTVTLDAVWNPAEGSRRPQVGAHRAPPRRRARRTPGRAHPHHQRPRGRRPPGADPMLLAIGAVRQHLVQAGLRARVGLVAEAGDAFDIHHFATLDRLWGGGGASLAGAGEHRRDLQRGSGHRAERSHGGTGAGCAHSGRGSRSYRRRPRRGC